MSIPDELMWPYYELVTDRAPQEIAALKQEVAGGQLHPMDAKMRLAKEVITGFHGADAARKAAENFQHVHRDRQPPTEVRVQKLRCGPPTRLWTIVRISDLAASRSEAERLIKQKAVEIDGLVIDDPRKEIDVTKPTSFLLRVGKKDFVRFVVEP